MTGAPKRPAIRAVLQLQIESALARYGHLKCRLIFARAEAAADGEIFGVTINQRQIRSREFQVMRKSDCSPLKSGGIYGEPIVHYV